MTILEVEQLSKRFGGLQAVDDVSFFLRQGAIKAVIAPNGAGKTTHFNLIAGMLTSTAGEIRFQGKAIQGMQPFRVAGMGIVRTFQNIKMFAGMTALENVMVGRHVRSKSGFMASLSASGTWVSPSFWSNKTPRPPWPSPTAAMSSKPERSSSKDLLRIC